MDIHVIDDLDDLIGVGPAVKIYKPRREEFYRNFKKIFWFEERNFDFLVDTFLPEYQQTRCGAVSRVIEIK